MARNIVFPKVWFPKPRMEGIVNWTKTLLSRRQIPYAFPLPLPVPLRSGNDME